MKFARSIETSPGLSKQRLARWDISYLDLGIYICFALSCSIVAATSVGALIGYDSSKSIADLSLRELFAVGGAAQTGSLIGWFAFRKICPNRPQNRPAELPEIVATALIGLIIVYIVLALIAPLWISLLQSIDFNHDEQDLVAQIRKGGSHLELAMMGLLIIVIAPVCEEIAYRGTLYRFMNGKMPDWLAIVIPSALFSAFHANLYASVPLFILGAALSLAYKRTGSLLTCILLHGLFNTVTFIGLLNPHLFES